MLEDARSLMRCARMQAWATWLRPTAGVLRVDCLAKRVCNAPDEHAMLQGVNEACAPRNDTLSHLFSIYIHPSPTFKGYSRGSIFRGREISPRIKVEWGHWSIVEVRLDATPSALLLGPLNSLLCLHGKPALVALHHCRGSLLKLACTAPITMVGLPSQHRVCPLTRLADAWSFAHCRKMVYGALHGCAGAEAAAALGAAGPAESALCVPVGDLRAPHPGRHHVCAAHVRAQVAHQCLPEA